MHILVCVIELPSSWHLSSVLKHFSKYVHVCVCLTCCVYVAGLSMRVECTCMSYRRINIPWQYRVTYIVCYLCVLEGNVYSGCDRTYLTCQKKNTVTFETDTTPCERHISEWTNSEKHPIYMYTSLARAARSSHTIQCPCVSIATRFVLRLIAPSIILITLLRGARSAVWKCFFVHE